MASRGFSLQSDKSQKSDSKKEHLVESHNEKERQRLHSKADPTMAMNEAEPSDPDLSNPTRWREERPLDTIRAFEAAIEGSYRNSMINSGGGNYQLSLPTPSDTYTPLPSTPSLLGENA
ncbi:hypothetical protein SLS63_004317 [Diaporthe eres]|uniref:Uncharacterized protein n=1 Tax=Diaporthe eres TaxID=83184 RepID=A0ABR1PEI8_DIAER